METNNKTQQNNLEQSKEIIINIKNGISTKLERKPSQSAQSTIETTIATQPPGGADFETAIMATEYGLFNYVLLLVGLPCCIATVYETSTMSYVSPSAECDLHLTLVDKGVLNAITYAGMITSAIPWGYFSDMLGRRKLLVYGYLLDFLCVLCCSMTQNVWTLMLFKYLGGFIICGPFAVLMSFISEFHGTKYRSRVMMIIGVFFSLATISLPGFAWAIIPRPWTLNIGDFFTMKSWQMFLAVCSLPSLIAGTAVWFLPESPKFLMSKGRYDEALQVFQTIYRWNTHNNRFEYPITKLYDELYRQDEDLLEAKEKANTMTITTISTTTINTISNEIETGTSPTLSSSSSSSVTTVGKEEIKQKKNNSFMSGLSQMLPLLRKPLLGKCCLVFTIQFCALLGLNTMRLWLPQLFTMVSNFENIDFYGNDGDNNETNELTANNLCGMIAYSVNKSAESIAQGATTGFCERPVINDSIYMNTIYVGLVGLGGYVVAGSLINACGSKNILIFGLMTSGCAGLTLILATNSWNIVTLTSIYVSIGSICSTALIGVIVNMFPTSLRTMTISLAMMFGRLGALIGNVIFPYLLAFGCLPAFLLVGLIMIVCSLLCTALPQTNKNPLQ